MLLALILLAILDLIVGVSNDAVNFLNSAIGSKVISVRNIMIIASIGIFLGAGTSNGMMEVARKGIFVPGEFYFNEIMIIFMAVMITDILLLDTFNNLALPTSTTVSIVFELLGAAVIMAVIKISMTEGESMAYIGKYINSAKALEIILGILLSVLVAFTVGAIVQFFSRIIFSFQFQQSKTIINAIFGGIAVTAVTYFIFIKGLKGTGYYDSIKDFIHGKEIYIMFVSFAFWTFLGYVLSKLVNFNILKFIIGIGTFSLALAFAGNDLVNFIGVPMAALNSYQAWHGSGVAATEFSMEILANKVPTQTLLLLLAGGIMVVTLWSNKKARKVVATTLNLARQNEVNERFEPNNLSRIVVRGASFFTIGIKKIFPEKWLVFLDNKFQKPEVNVSKEQLDELPAFDMVRASVNLVLAGILISVATSYKLPLSTTYVTFMVAMGTSLADRAWGRESAVYRVAGVFNVIGGWFLTAIVAFIVSGTLTFIIFKGGITAAMILLVFALGTIIYSTIRHSKKEKAQMDIKIAEQKEIKTIYGVLDKSSDHIAGVTQRVNKMYSHVLTDLASNNLNKLSKTKKHVKKMMDEVNDLRNNVFYFIKSLDESSVISSQFYIMVLSYLQDITQSIDFIANSSFVHVNNNHKPLKKEQLHDLNVIDEKLTDLMQHIQTVFENDDYEKLNNISLSKEKILTIISEILDKEVNRLRKDRNSSKRNATLYFGILLETKDLVKALSNIVELYQENYEKYKASIAQD